MVEPHGKAGSVAWAVADELSKMSRFTVVLTPDAKSVAVHEVVAKVQKQVFNKKDKKLGPFPVAWERKEEEEAASLLECVAGQGTMPVRSASSAIAALQSRHSRAVCARLERMRNLRGVSEISQQDLQAMVEGVIRDAARFGPLEVGGQRVMTIQLAKNRQFRQVLVLWPHSATGAPEQQRRLLYNAVTRAKELCSVVICGQNRTTKAPFA